MINTNHTNVIHYIGAQLQCSIQKQILLRTLRLKLKKKYYVVCKEENYIFKNGTEKECY